MKQTALFLVLFMVTACPAQARDSLGVFESWGAFRDPKAQRCHAISEPARKGSKGRWRPFAAIGYWPTKSVHGQMHFRMSREKATKAQVTLGIGVRRFTLVASGADAWAPNGKVDAAIIAAIRSGTSMSIQTIAKNGAPFADVYALRGAATAIDAAALGCAKLGGIYDR